MGLDKNDAALINHRLESIEETLTGFAELMQNYIRLQEKSMQHQKEIDYAIRLAREASAQSEVNKTDIVSYKASISAYKYVFGIVSPVITSLVTAGLMIVIKGG